MSQALATFIHNPFDITDRDTARIDLDLYPTIGALCAPLVEAGSRTSVAVNGQVVAQDLWSEYRLNDGDHVLVKPKVEFGGAWAAAAAIGKALMGAGKAIYAFKLFGLPVGAAAMNVGFAVAGGYLMRALTPKPKMPHLRDVERANSAVYGLVCRRY